MTLQEAKEISGKCVHYAMCRIDFLGTDFYHDHTDPEERQHAQAAAHEAAETIDRHMKKMNGRSAAVVPFQGLCRKENLLYAQPAE